MPMGSTRAPDKGQLECACYRDLSHAVHVLSDRHEDRVTLHECCLAPSREPGIPTATTVWPRGLFPRTHTRAVVEPVRHVKD